MKCIQVPAPRFHLPLSPPPPPPFPHLGYCQEQLIPLQCCCPPSPRHFAEPRPNLRRHRCCIHTPPLLLLPPPAPCSPTAPAPSCTARATRPATSQGGSCTGGCGSAERCAACGEGDEPLQQHHLTVPPRGQQASLVRAEGCKQGHEGAGGRGSGGGAEGEEAWGERGREGGEGTRMKEEVTTMRQPFRSCTLCTVQGDEEGNESATAPPSP